MPIVLTAGCANQISNLPKTVEITPPATWQQLKKQSGGEKQISNNWLDSFEDAQLDSYVDLALKRNPDLLKSSAQLKSAFSRVKVAGSSLWPSLSGSVNKTDVETKANQLTTNVKTVSASLNVAWELDVWGRLTHRRKSALYAAKAQAQFYKAGELALVANVSRAWFNLISAKLLLDLSYKQLDSFQDTNDLVEESYKRGLRSALDVYSSRTNVQLQKSQLNDAQYQYLANLRAFKVLVGEYPSDELEFKSQLPVLNEAVTSGLPAQLMLRRPDILAAQLVYESSIANAKAAHRDRFPALRFTGSLSDSRKTFDQLFENGNAVWSLLLGVTQPIFQGGQLKARQQQAVYDAQASYADFLKTTLNAYREVENALTQQDLLLKRHAAVLKALEYAQAGFELALERYKNGIAIYDTVLQSQRQLFESQRSEINLRNAILQNRIALHLALGGSFKTTEPVVQEK